MSYAGSVLDGFLVHMCRKCTAVQHYDGLHDSIFNSSKAFLYTYKLCFNYTDSMLLMRLPFAAVGRGVPLAAIAGEIQALWAGTMPVCMRHSPK